MIVKLHRAGRSFTGVCRYLSHDAKAETSERVAWTQTLNLANDDLPSAIDEMLWTFRSADLLKREAGISTGGSKLEKPVKHFSLSWPHGETPTKEHMVETVQAYLRHMGWSDQQAVLFSHTDTRHPHVHVVMNSVSPHDGRAARDSNDWRRSEAFALQYERDHGQIHCEQRLKPRGDRDATPTRESWQRFKKAEVLFERSEVDRLIKAPGYFERHDDKTMNGREWEALKAFQKHQREQFFADGKEAFRAVRKEAFREVRDEFRPQWGAYYAAKKNGFDKGTLAEMKIAILAAQNKVIDDRRIAACDALREQRDQSYKVILKQQEFDRSELTRRQGQGLRTYQLMDVVYPVPETPPAMTRQADSEAWKLREPLSQDQERTSGRFDRNGQTIIRPSGYGDEQTRRVPGVVRRSEAPPRENATDGFGRDAKPVRRDDSIRKSESPARAPAEASDVSREEARVEKTREMTDQRAAKEEIGKEAGMRASWNRHRRSRGGRD